MIVLICLKYPFFIIKRKALTLHVSLRFVKASPVILSRASPLASVVGCGFPVGDRLRICRGIRFGIRLLVSILLGLFREVF